MSDGGVQALPGVRTDGVEAVPPGIQLAWRVGFHPDRGRGRRGRPETTAALVPNDQTAWSGERTQDLSCFPAFRIKSLDASEDCLLT